MRLFILTLLILNSLSSIANAYVDPGVFSLFLTYILSGVVGAYIIFRAKFNIFWNKFKNFFKKNKKNP
jgi:O-antigen/teichoic acid export membrane protein